MTVGEELRCRRIVAGDELGHFERMWLCLGLGTVEAAAVNRPAVLIVGDERPLLVFPAADPAPREVWFGWACAELVRQEYGWLETMRRMRLALDAQAA